MGKQTNIKNVEKFCEEQNIKLTSKRKEILFSLLNSDKALSAYDLVKILENKSGSSIPAMSVYRILDFLENSTKLLDTNVLIAIYLVIRKNLNLDHEIKLIFINLNLIQDKKEQVKYLLDEIVKIGNKLYVIEKELSFQNNNLKTSMDKIKYYSHIFHILIVFMQILNALFLLIFFYFLINILAFTKKIKS